MLLKKITAQSSVLLLLFLFSFSSCIKDEFDSPPADGEDPAGISATTTIAALKARYDGTNPEEITDTDSVIIQGVVTSSDRAGNFYKTLVIQDNTAGISIRLDQNDLYVDYPVGRRVFIVCNGLWLGDYGDLVQLGGALDDSDPQNPGVLAVPAALIPNYILKGKYNVPVAPIVLTIDQLDLTTYQNMLIQLNDVEFATGELGKTYADAVEQFSENRTLTDCNGNTTILRSSGFASFAGDTLPEGNGSIIAIFSIFRDDFQLLINDVTDVHFDSARCTPGGDVDGILGIRYQYSGEDFELGSNEIITGIVISNNDNFDSRNMVIQDSIGGIVVRFASAHSFTVGDKVEVDVSGQTVTDFNGLVQIDAVPNANAQKVGTGSITPRVATIAQINTNANIWESTLVEIANVTISGSGTYSGTTELNDGTGDINMFTRSGASFAGDSYPTGAVTITGVVGDFNGAQINIRSTDDVQ